MSVRSYFAEYYAEERRETIAETEAGFLVYRIYETADKREKEIMLCDLYVAPEHRRKGEAQKLTELVEKIGRDAGCTHASCYIQHPDGTDETRRKTTYKLKLYIKNGFIIHSMNESQILLYKNL